MAVISSPVSSLTPYKLSSDETHLIPSDAQKEVLAQALISLSEKGRGNYEAAIQKVADLAAFLSDDEVKHLPDEDFAKVVSHIKEYPLKGEWGIAELCLRRVGEELKHLSDQRYDPPIMESIRWNAIPSEVLGRCLRALNSPAILSLIYPPKSPRAPTFVLVSDTSERQTLFWHPGDITGGCKVGRFKMECKSDSGLTYSPTFEIRCWKGRDFKNETDPLHVVINLEKREATVALLLVEFEADVRVNSTLMLWRSKGLILCQDSSRSAVEVINSHDSFNSVISVTFRNTPRLGWCSGEHFSTDLSQRMSVPVTPEVIENFDKPLLLNE